LTCRLAELLERAAAIELVTDHPALAQTGWHPVLSALHR